MSVLTSLHKATTFKHCYIVAKRVHYEVVLAQPLPLPRWSSVSQYEINNTGLSFKADLQHGRKVQNRTRPLTFNGCVEVAISAGLTCRASYACYNFYFQTIIEPCLLLFLVTVL